MVMDPTALRRILLENVANYPKSQVTKNLLKPAIIESLFIAEGAHWRWQRRAATPVFSQRNVMNLSPIISSAMERCCQRFSGSSNQAIDFLNEMVKTTFDVISGVTFSGDRGFDRAAVHHAIDSYIAEAGRVSLFDILGLPDWVPRPNRLRSGPALKAMKSLADNVINEHCQQAKNHPSIY